MKRRDFIKMLGAVGTAAAFPGMCLRSAQAAETQPFTGKALISLYAGGGWDHSSFCDPRENPSVNHWADNNKAGIAGNLRYAPFAENAEFFEKHFQRMLVFNGMNLQTNGHGGAAMTHGSGGLAGYPVLNAIYAAVNGAGLPLAWLAGGGGPSEHMSLPGATGLPSGDRLRSLANPNYKDGKTLYFRSSDHVILERYRRERLQAQLLDTGMPYADAKVSSQLDALVNSSLINRIEAVMPEEIDTVDLKGDNNRLISKIHLMLIAIKAGICVTGNMSTGGFDTHNNHDQRHAVALTRLTRAADYLWTKAEEMGMADRIVLHLASDVGRTPRYNGNNGKDHWSTGSAIIMANAQPWGNRIVGLSSSDHRSVNINPTTLQPAGDEGVSLKTAHLHQTLRRILGIENDPVSKQYAFQVAEIDTLNPVNSSPINV